MNFAALLLEGDCGGFDLVLEVRARDDARDLWRSAAALQSLPGEADREDAGED